jgi:hypothetical protein
MVRVVVLLVSASQASGATWLISTSARGVAEATRREARETSVERSIFLLSEIALVECWVSRVGWLSRGEDAAHARDTTRSYTLLDGSRDSATPTTSDSIQSMTSP